MPTLLLGIPPPRPPLPRRMPGQGRLQPESQLGPRGMEGRAGPPPCSSDTSRLGTLNTGKALCLPPQARRKALRGQGAASRLPFLLASVFPPIECNFQVQAPPPPPEHL